ncbi:MAG: hypothetical protein WCR48_01385 [Bacteroidales bacterium]
MHKEVYYRGVIVACSSFLVMPLACKAQTAKVDKPNIVFILADDMGYGDISCLNPNSGIMTPHIDRLCSQGCTSEMRIQSHR